MIIIITEMQTDRGVPHITRYYSSRLTHTTHSHHPHHSHHSLTPTHPNKTSTTHANFLSRCSTKLNLTSEEVRSLLQLCFHLPLMKKAVYSPLKMIKEFEVFFGVILELWVLNLQLRYYSLYSKLHQFSSSSAQLLRWPFAST